MVRKRNNGMRENAPSKPPCEYIIQNDFGFAVVEMLNWAASTRKIQNMIKSSPLPLPPFLLFMD